MSRLGGKSPLGHSTVWDKLYTVIANVPGLTDIHVDKNITVWESHP